MRIMREIRFSLAAAESSAVFNSWAGWPQTDSLAPFLTLRMTVAGPVDPQSGYLCNIKEIDDLLRRRAVPLLRERQSTDPSRARKEAVSSSSAPPRSLTVAARKDQSIAGHYPRSAASILPDLFDALRSHPPGRTSLAALELAVTPYLRFAVHHEEPNMVHLTQAFEFSAAHRLYCTRFSEEENRRIFGKCANPNGHGHNYVVEVTIAAAPDSTTGPVVPLQRFQATVKERVIDRFDHKHLNADCPEFAELNPTIENITRVIWDLLVGLFDPARLTCVRVWETPKTYAEYRGERE